MGKESGNNITEVIRNTAGMTLVLVMVQFWAGENERGGIGENPWEDIELRWSSETWWDRQTGGLEIGMRILSNTNTNTSTSTNTMKTKFRQKSRKLARKRTVMNSNPEQIQYVSLSSDQYLIKIPHNDLLFIYLFIMWQINNFLTAIILLLKHFPLLLVFKRFLENCFIMCFPTALVVDLRVYHFHSSVNRVSIKNMKRQKTNESRNGKNLVEIDLAWLIQDTLLKIWKIFR